MPGFVLRRLLFRRCHVDPVPAVDVCLDAFGSGLYPKTRLEIIGYNSPASTASRVCWAVAI
jgi:hypothetical protein